MSLIDATLAAILVCPKCHGSLQENEEHRRLECPACQLGYEVRDGGIPIMLINDAVDLTTGLGEVAASE